MPADNPRRIDTHFHSIPPAYRTALGASSPTVRVPDWSPELALKTMDRCGIAAAVTELSIPGVHFGDDKRARALARACNEESAEIMARHPRLGAVATVPLPDIDGACAEAIHALDVLKLDGVGLFTNYRGKYLGDAAFEPLLKILDARSAVVPLHPVANPANAGIELRAHPSWVEYPFDTTRAVLSLVLADAMERFPNIRFILPHAGGTIPFLAWRLAHIVNYQVANTSEPMLRERFGAPMTNRYGEKSTPELFMSLFRRFWYDTALVPGAANYGAIKEIADPDKIVFGSDWPYAYDVVVDHAVKDHEALPLTAAERAAIDRGNALKLFPRLKDVG